MTILIFSNAFFELAGFARVLIKDGHTVIFCPTAEAANTTVEQVKIDVLLSDERELEWVKQLIARFPSLNIAIFSNKKDDIFHQMTEGYGVLMKVPRVPEKTDAQTLLKKVHHLATLAVT